MSDNSEKYINGFKDLNEMFGTSFRKFADKEAAKDGDLSLSYRELDELSVKAGGYIRAFAGSQKDHNIAIMFDPAMVRLCVIFGIFRAGAAYVPLDPDAPEERNTAITKNVCSEIMICDENNREKALSIADKCGISSEKVLTVSMEDIANFSGDTSETERRYDSLYCIIHTSGSTGVPKGVKLMDKNLINFCVSSAKMLGVTSDDSTCLYANYSFDASFIDTFIALSTGARVLFIDPVLKKDIVRLNKFMIENKVTYQFLTTAMYPLFAGLENNVLRVLMTGGEKLHEYIPNSYRLFNVYGPTETCAFVTYEEVTENCEDIPIGVAIDNVRAVVMNDNGEEAADGEEGELCLQGESVSAGYINTSSASFVELPDEKGGMMYRTGDIVKRMAGKIYYVGRRDLQIKYRGFRIELGEIDKHILRTGMVKSCAAVFYNTPELKYIASFYTGDDVAEDELKEKISETLPEYMIPSKLIHIDELPLNVNGKVDMKKLKEILENEKNETALSSSEKTGLEWEVRKLWSSLLAIPEDFDGSIPFVKLGGHSILSLIMMKKLREEKNIDISITEFLQNDTLNSFVELIRRKTGIESDAEEKIFKDDKASRYSPYDLNDIQRSYFIGRDESLNLGGNTPTHFYMELRFKDLDEEKFRKAFTSIVMKHDALRMKIDEDGTAYTRNADEEFSFIHEPEDCSGMDENAFSNKLEEARDEMINKKRDLLHDPLIEIRLFRRSDGETVASVFMDGLIADAWSVQLMIKELDDLYSGKCRDISDESHLFRDYNIYLDKVKETAAYKKAEDFWTERCGSLSDKLSFFSDKDIDEINSPSINEIEVKLSNEKWTKFKANCRKHGATTSETLLTLFCSVVSLWAENKNFIINVPVLRRYFGEVNFEDTVGTCSTFSVFDYRPEENETFAERLRRTSEQFKDMQAYSLCSGNSILSMLGRQHGVPGYSTPVVFTGVPENAEFQTESFRRTYVKTRTTQMLMDVFSMMYDDSIIFTFIYVSDILGDSVMKQLSSVFINELEKLSDDEKLWDQTLNITVPFSESGVALNENDLAKAIKEKYNCESYILKLADGLNAPFGVPAELYTVSGEDTGYTGINYGNAGIDVLGSSDSCVRYRDSVIYTDCIESAMKKIDNISDCVCVFDDQLYAFYTSDASISRREVEEKLREVLPEKMIPDKFREIREIPRTETGKADISRLNIRRSPERKRK